MCADGVAVHIHPKAFEFERAGVPLRVTLDSHRRRSCSSSYRDPWLEGHTERQQQLDGEKVVLAEARCLADLLEQLRKLVAAQRAAARPFGTTGVQAGREIGGGVAQEETTPYTEGKNPTREAQ